MTSGWVRKRFLPRSSVGRRAVAMEFSYDHERLPGRTERQGWGYVALENDANSTQGLGLGAGLPNISCTAHPYGLIAQILRRGPSFRPLVGAPPAP